MSTWRLLDTGALSGRLNMGIDLAMLQLYASGESPSTLRFYQWSPPAISLGYFQRRHAIDLVKCQNLGFDVVRRPTGGRAVLHHNDVTYSIVSGVKDGIPGVLSAAYRLICEGLLAGFRLLGFEAESGSENVRMPEVDVCFVRSAIGDIVYHGKKFVGSAQRWSASSFVQHGAIILEPQIETWTAILTPGSISDEILRKKLNARITSLYEILGRRIDICEVKTALTKGIERTLNAEFKLGELSQKEWTLAHEIASKSNL